MGEKKNRLYKEYILHSSKNVNENGCHAYLPLSYQNDTDEGEETLLGFLYFGGRFLAL